VRGSEGQWSRMEKWGTMAPAGKRRERYRSSGIKVTVGRRSGWPLVDRSCPQLGPTKMAVVQGRGRAVNDEFQAEGEETR